MHPDCRLGAGPASIAAASFPPITQIRQSKWPLESRKTRQSSSDATSCH